MKNLNFTLFLIGIVFLASCKEKEDKTGNGGTGIDSCIIDDADLILSTEYANALVPEKYYQDYNLLFISENGDSLTMNRTFSLDTIFIATTEFPCGGTTQYLETHQEEKRVFFESGNSAIDMRLDILVASYAHIENDQYIRRESLTYYPTNIGLGLLYPYGAMNIITFEDGEIIGQLSSTRSELELNGRAFQNVFVIESAIFTGDQSFLYYNTEFGVIAMEDPSKNLWYFDSFIE